MRSKSVQQVTLPESFKSLQPLVSEWALPTEHQRREKRATSPMKAINDYYGVLGPQMRAIATHLDFFPMGTLPDPETALLHLAQMYMETAIAVEFFGQPEVPRGIARQRWVIASSRR
jgi:hypothetical protein